jgi:protein-disulfide isomerase
LHDHAVIAALGAECAAQQRAFRQYHDVLFGIQDSIGAIAWGEVALRAGIPDTGEFNQCLERDEPRAALRSDSAAAATIGVVSTPTVIVNGLLFSGTPSIEEVEKYLPRAVKRERY